MSRAREILENMMHFMIFCDFQDFSKISFFQKFYFYCKMWEIKAGKSALRVLPAETWLTVYRRLRVRLQLAASWSPEKFRLIYNLGCLFCRGNAFVHHGSCHLYFSYEVQRKIKLGSYSAIHLPEQSELGSSR